MASAITPHQGGCSTNDQTEKDAYENKYSLDSDLVTSARQMIHFRREMEKYFPKFTFHDEAWDVLLELFVSSAQGEELCVKQVLFSTGMPATSAMRLLERLEGAGLIFKSRSARDRRQTLVSFTEEGINSTSSMLRSFSQLLPSL